MEKFKTVSAKKIGHDCLIGMIIALVSVPISMGYAQVAGLPVQYGLYGSMLSVLVFGILSTSPRFVFGVDAAPAALTGALLTELGIAYGSTEAVSVMPQITLLTAGWLLLFWMLRAGRFVKYISESVLGGCVSGIASIVVLTQIPRLFGGTIGTGHAPSLLQHIFEQAAYFNALSFALGVGTVALILFSRKRWPEISMSVILLVIGVLLTAIFHIDRYGVAMVPAVQSGLPMPVRPNAAPLLEDVEEAVLSTLTIAIVIVSETLVSTREMAREYGDKIDNQREILAYAAGNLTASLFGSSPVSGSISRTKRANHFHVKSQWMSVSACATMALVLLFGTELLAYIPVPILTGILIASLISMMEFSLAAELWRLDRSHFYIFLAAFLAEFLGLMEGVLAGVVLSFASFTIRASSEPRYYLGCMEGEEGFFALSLTPQAKPIEHTVLYQFTGPLFFANIDDFENDIEHEIDPNTELVIVTGVASVDVAAANRLLAFYRSLQSRKISLFIAGHTSSVNEQLIDYGAEELIHDGVVKARLTEALLSGGLTSPYPLNYAGKEDHIAGSVALEGFNWAYGKYAGSRLEQLAWRMSGTILSGGTIDESAMTQAERAVVNEYWNETDEDAFPELLNLGLTAVAQNDPQSVEAFNRLAQGLLERRVELELKLAQRGDIAAARVFAQLRLRREADFGQSYPEVGRLLTEQRVSYMEALRQKNPVAADLIESIMEAPTVKKDAPMPSDLVDLNEIVT